MKSKTICSLLFLGLLLISNLSNALTQTEQAIVDGSAQVKLVKQYFIERGKASVLEQIVYKVVKPESLVLTVDGYLSIKTSSKSIYKLVRGADRIYLDLKGNIISFSLEHAGLEGLSLLKELPKLRVLHLYDNQFESSVVELSDLRSLEEFHLSNPYPITNTIKEVKLGKGLPRLRRLMLRLMPLIKITHLSKLKKLNYLNVSDTHLKKIDELEKLKQLRWLEINASHIEQLPSMKYFPKLEVINAMDSRITDLKDIASSQTIKKISLHRTVAGQNIQKYPQSLEELEIGGGILTKIPNLRNLKNLKKLSIIANKVTKIENLEGLNNLKELDFRYSSIEKIEGLDDLVNLEVLNFEKTKITKIEGLKALVNLEILNLSETGVSKIEGLSSQTKLVRLFLKDTKIKKIENIRHMLGLKEFSVVGSPVEEYDLDETKDMDVLVGAYGTPYSMNLEKENLRLYNKLRRENKL
ncbi:hypothetical protein MNBD_GAMMA09-1816 [hydrothermal vent metagenome]|uniref:Leucine-rich repeat domain-containing protein n=1 Tax=hydrothermal vent metagenome TaxID=652676 RepID=A0A3B0XY82_9ZZZZ